jgi:hypothetical protein
MKRYPRLWLCRRAKLPSIVGRLISVLVILAGFYILE